jgi:hypothetical protein
MFKPASLALIAVSLLALGGAASCNKQSAKDPARAQMEKMEEQAEAMRPGGDQGLSPEMVAQMRERYDKNVEALPADEVANLKAALINRAEEYDFTYDQKEREFNGGGLPIWGIGISEMVMSAYSASTDKAKLKTSAGASESVDKFYVELIEKMRAAAEVVQSKEAPLPAKSETADLVPAYEPVGDWRSIKEIREGETTFLVQHDDKYYKLLVIDAKGKMVLQEHNAESEEKMLKTEFPYRYDSDTGELTLIGPEGSPYMVFILKAPQDDPNMLYVKTKDDFIYTAYERVGNAGKAESKGESQSKAAGGELPVQSAAGAGKSGGKSGAKDAKGK